MSQTEMRKALKGAYLSPNWEEKVDAMSDAQVFVIYTKFKKEGKIK